uniref:Uncharacterized protein n=1 Tax=Heterorhabditis bacteriophora TaxID=37862 RepID=A0A1I7XF54_HETBA
MLAILTILATTLLAFWFYKKVKSVKTLTHSSVKSEDSIQTTHSPRITPTSSDFPQTPILDSSRKSFSLPGRKSSSSQHLAESNLHCQNYPHQSLASESQAAVERQISTELTIAPPQILDKPSSDVTTARSVVNDQPTEGVSTAKDVSTINEKQTEDAFTAKEVSATFALTEDMPTARCISTINKSLRQEDQGSDMKVSNRSLPKTSDTATQAKEKKMKKSQRRSISANKETKEKLKGKKRSRSSKSKTKPHLKEQTSDSIQKA